MTARCTVVGDALLDCDITGTADRVCPDAPALVLEVGDESFRPGGAALAAVIAAREGHEVTLVTALADDEPGRRLRHLLEREDVRIADLELHGPTPQKVRVRASDTSLVRLDRGGEACAFGGLTRRAREAITTADAVLVSDYGRGMAADPAIRTLLAERAHHAPIVWDPHPRGPTPVPDVALATPNEAEARLRAGLDGMARGVGLPVVAFALVRSWCARAVAVTLGERGALVAQSDGAPLAVAPPQVSRGDTCGAGDCFAVGALDAFVRGGSTADAVEHAVRSAAGFVAAGAAAGFLAGNSAVTRPASGEGTITTLDALLPRLEAVRRAGGTVVATSGCFDLLHVGHVETLRSARALGDILVVLLNTDESVRALKGPSRPIQSEHDRAAVLAALEPVDAVVLFSDRTPVPLLRRMRPDLFVKGGDYQLADLPEAQSSHEWGGHVVLVPQVMGRSTTRLVEEAVLRAS